MKKFWGTLAFWGTLFLGPVVVAALSWVSYSVVGAGDSFPSAAIPFLAQVISCYLAYRAVVKVTGEPGGYCARYNCLIATIGTGMMAITDFTKGATARGCTMVVCAVVFGYCLREVIRAYGDVAKDEQEVPEDRKPKVKEKLVKSVPAWVLWACVGMFVAAAVLMVGVYIPGVRRQAAEAAAEQAESASNEGYNQGYYAGYDKGKEEQWVSDRQSLVVRGKNLKMIIESVESEYGIEPAKAYDILNAYNNNADHGGYSWDEYQEAIQVIIYTVSLFPYR